MNTYGIVKETVKDGYVRFMRISSGYDMNKAIQRCTELNRVQKPKNNSKLSVSYFISKDKK